MDENTICYYIENPSTNIVPKEITIKGWAFSIISKNNVAIYLNGKLTNTIRTERYDVSNAYSNYKNLNSNCGFETDIILNPRITNELKIIISDEKNNIIIRKEIITEELYVQRENNRVRKTTIFALSLIKKLLNKNFPNSRNQIKNTLIELTNSLKMNPVKKNIDPYQQWKLRNPDVCFYDCSKHVKPLISVIIPAYNSNEKFLSEAIESIIKQTYNNWEIIIVDDCSEINSVKTVTSYYSNNDYRIHYYRLFKNSHISIATNEGVSHAKGDYIFLMDHDDLITPNALMEIIKVVNENNWPDIIYSDDDKINEEGTEYYSPQFKPDYSPELLLSYMYISHIFVIKRKLFLDVGGCREGYEGSQDYDLMLRLTEITNNIYHIPKILYHWRATRTSTAFSVSTKPYSIVAGEKTLNDAINRRKLPVKVIQPKYAENVMNLFKLIYDSKYSPMVSIIIPNKNHKEDLKRCIDSIENKSTYNNYEIIVVDNISDDNETLQYLSTLNHKVIKCKNKNEEFNFSYNVNIGVDNCNGEYIVLLNNDTEIITETWIEELLAYACIPNVGAVGARLLYRDNTIQHAGVVIKMSTGIAGHCFKNQHRDDLGNMMFSVVAKNYSAVTAACIMSKKDIFYSVGKFDENLFAVSFNDVDYCLKLIKNGYRVVYDGNVELYHYEGKTRGVESNGHYSNPKEEYNLVTKWKINENYVDPYYNVNLDLKTESFNINSKYVHLVNHHNKLTILLITHNLNYEGAPLMQYTIAKHLCQQYNFIIISPHDGKLKNKYEKLGIKTIIKQIHIADVNNQNENYHTYIEMIKTFKPDIAYVNTIESYPQLKLLQNEHIPTIWGIHESIQYKYYFAGIFNEKNINDLFAKTTRITFVSDITKKLYHNLDNDNFITIKNGVDFDRIINYQKTSDTNLIKNTIGIESNEKVILITGTVCKRKGQMDLVNSILALLNEGYNIKCIIAGNDSTDYGLKIKKKISDTNNKDKIIMTGVCDDIFQYYSIADIFVCTSYEESSPSVILEAMAFKKPIISTNVYGIPELIRNNIDALMINPGDVKTLIEMIKILLTDPTKSKTLAENAYYRAKTFFNIKRMIDNYENLFETVYSEGTNSKKTIP